MKSKYVKNKLAIILLAVSPLASADTLLYYDDFNELDPVNGAWLFGSWDLGSRTEVSNIPTIGSEESTSYVSLPLDTYNPNSPGTKLLGSELWSLSEYTVNDGIEFAARVRANNVDLGMICSFFAFNSENELQDEIDIEILTNEFTDTFWATSWNNWDKTSPVFNDYISHQDTIVTVENYDYGQWTDYAIRWYQDRIEWYVNNELVNVHYDVLPDLPLRVHANFWGAGSEWASAYDGNLMPVFSEIDNTRYEYQIDYIKVTRLGDTILPTTELQASHDNGTVNLRWALQTGYADSFRIYRAKRPVGKREIDFVQIAETETGANEFNDQPGKGHWVYQVVAVYDDNETTSNAVSLHSKKVKPVKKNHPKRK